MSLQAEKPFDFARICTRTAHCPICAEPNGCRLETGEPYKGPCWCERLTLSATTLRRLLAELPEPRCLCRACLEAIAAKPEITWNELASRRSSVGPATPGAGDFYLEGTTVVFTEQYHLARGECCGSGCRHCPFDAPADAGPAKRPSSTPG